MLMYTGLNVTASNSEPRGPNAVYEWLTLPLTTPPRPMKPVWVRKSSCTPSST
jgi:hypothetical protein